MAVTPLASEPAQKKRGRDWRSGEKPIARLALADPDGVDCNLHDLSHLLYD